ncbi:UNKNOWN [Stylonychia lemnae]|uniref:histidine kinase n=1 Tax=Stylonychia lemnae TaxID=5949 RepID=A0A078AJ12_STYLE|nr:UNKNOWN [Stylonychia lemnae]|eukprot:CDW82214.1 UNKNOWN [Stylonychia lemnae]
MQTGNQQPQFGQKSPSKSGESRNQPRLKLQSNDNGILKPAGSFNISEALPSSRDETRKSNYNNIQSENTASNSNPSRNRPVQRMVTNILGQYSAETSSIVKNTTVKSNQDPSNTELKRMIKIMNNLTDHGLQIYIQLPIFLATLTVSGQDKIIEIANTSFFTIHCRLSILMMIFFAVYFTLLNHNHLNNNNMILLRRLRKTYTTQGEISEQQMHRLFAYLQSLVDLICQFINYLFYLKSLFVEDNKNLHYTQKFKRPQLFISPVTNQSNDSQFQTLEANSNKVNDDRNIDRFNNITFASTVNRQCINSTGKLSYDKTQGRDQINMKHFTFAQSIESKENKSFKNESSEINISSLSNQKERLLQNEDELVREQESAKFSMSSNDFSLRKERNSEQKGDFEIYSSKAINQNGSNQKLYLKSQSQLISHGQGLSPSQRYLGDKISEQNEDEQSQISPTNQDVKDQPQNLRSTLKSYNIQVINDSISQEEVRDITVHPVRKRSNRKCQLKDLHKLQSQEYSIGQFPPSIMDNQYLRPVNPNNSKEKQKTFQMMQVHSQGSFKSQKSGAGNKIDLQFQGKNLRFNKKISQQLVDFPLESARSSFVSTSSPTYTQTSFLNENFDFGFLKNNYKITPINFNQKKPGNMNQEFIISDYQKFEIRKSLNWLGAMYMIGFWIYILMIREYYLQQNFFFQYCVYNLIYLKNNFIFHSELLKIVTYVMFFCTLQYQVNDEKISFQDKVFHVVVNGLFVYLMINYQYSYSRKYQITKQKINQIIQSDNHFKNLVQLIPYGIAVLNLEDVSHYNNPFGKVLGIKKQKEVLGALTRFQRKLTLNENSSQQQNLNNIQNSQTSGGTKKSKYTNLKEDLNFILNNKEATFKETDHIFDIFFLDKEEAFIKRNSSIRETPSSINNRAQSYHDSHNSTVIQARKYYSISISPIDWNDKPCLLLTIKDITHEMIIDQKKIVDRLRNMIFKSFSHELKTPLNGIIMSLDTSIILSKRINQSIVRNYQGWQDESINQGKQLRLSLKIMKSCAYVLKNIMHDFFDYNQLQNNELVLNIKEFDLLECIHDIEKIVKHQIQDDRVQFACKIEFQNTGGLVQAQNQTRVSMVADRDRLQQILLNLLMNAIKFTSQGKIELEVYVKQNPQYVKFRVKDTGVGIEEERLPYIFNLFEKNEKQNIQKYLSTKRKSARMGLPISQNLCQQMGGKIIVKSKLGNGSIFTFALPLKNQDREIFLLQHKSTSDYQNNKEISDCSSAIYPVSPLDIRKRCSFEENKLNLEQNGENPTRIYLDINQNNCLMDTLDQQRFKDQDDIQNAFKLGQKSYSSKQEFKKSNSKEFFIDSKKKLGAFDLVFKSPNSKDQNFKFLWNNSLNDEQDDTPTPKLMHSNTNIEQAAKYQELQKDMFSPTKIRKMRTANNNNTKSTTVINDISTRQNLTSSQDASNQRKEFFTVEQVSTSKNQIINPQIDEALNQDQKKDSDSKQKDQYLSPEEVQFIQQNSNFSFQNYLNQKKITPTKGNNGNNTQSKPNRQFSIGADNQSDTGSVSDVATNQIIQSPLTNELQNFRIIETIEDSKEEQEENKDFKLVEFDYNDNQKSYASILAHAKRKRLSKRVTQKMSQQLRIGDQTFSNKDFLKIKDFESTLNHQEFQLKIQSQDMTPIDLDRELLDFQDDCQVDSERYGYSRYDPSRQLQKKAAQVLFDPQLKDQQEFKIGPDQMLNKLEESVKPNQVDNDSSPHMSLMTVRDKNDKSPREAFQNLIIPKKQKDLMLQPRGKSDDNYQFLPQKHLNQKLEGENNTLSSQNLRSNSNFNRRITWINNESNYQEELKIDDSILFKDNNNQDSVQSFSIKVDKSQINSQNSSKKRPQKFSFWPNSNVDLMLPGLNARDQTDIQIRDNKQDEFYSSPPRQRDNSNQSYRNYNNSNQNNQSNIIFTHSHPGTPINSQIQEQPPHQCPVVMVVDDIQTNRFAIEQMLLLIFDIKSLLAQNGQEAINRIKEFYRQKTCNCIGLKAILMDLEMPVMNGIDATIELRRMMRQKKLPEIPIIAVTAYLDERENCIANGMKDFSKFLQNYLTYIVVKPISKQMLKEFIRKFDIV